MGRIQQGTFNNLKDGCLAFWSLLKSSPFQRFMRLNKILKYYRDHLLAYMPMNHLIPGRESRTLTADSLCDSTQHGGFRGVHQGSQQVHKLPSYSIPPPGLPCASFSLCLLPQGPTQLCSCVCYSWTQPTTLALQHILWSLLPQDIWIVYPPSAQVTF